MTSWWQDAVAYSIFPRSFQDSNGDGVGDIKGITSRLDYLSWLGVDLVWLGPVYRSPMIDAGYDISDFNSIDPLFGTLEDFDQMLAEMHQRGMRLIMDFVPNHTSDQHPWFVESRSSRHNPKRDWYVWRDGKAPDVPPTNWIDNTDRSAWAWDEQTSQWYYHLFLPSQPDLNLRNPAVVEAIEASMRFWLDRGIDGFRMDSAMNLVEDELFRDEPMDEGLEGGPPGWMDHLFTSDRPETHDLIAHFRRVMDEYPDKVLVGEVMAPLPRIMHYYGTPDRPMLHLPFNNQLMKTEPWDARKIDAAIEQFMLNLPEDAWPNWVIGSHDVPRVATRLGQAQARVAALLLLTLPGTPFIYYGDELGLERSEFSPEDAVDPYEPYGYGRDAERGPMPWNDGLHAGFTTGAPWLPPGRSHRTCHVERLREMDDSILTLHRQLIELRRRHPQLRGKTYEAAWGNQNVLAYFRGKGKQRFFIAANFSEQAEKADLGGRGTIVVSTHRTSELTQVSGSVALEPNEAVVVRCQMP